jgi:transposase-like protein
MKEAVMMTKVPTFREKQILFADADKARRYLEAVRWPDGPVCPHCQSKEPYRIEGRENSKRPARPGLLKCKACRKQFTVTVGTIFEDSHVPLNKWLLAIERICASKKGISAHQLHRELGITYKSAWFLAHRIRWAMTQDPLSGMLGGIVEADETYVGGRAAGKRGRGAGRKIKVFSLVERAGRSRSFAVPDVKGKRLKGLIRENVLGTAHLMTDEFWSYQGADKIVARHSTVQHGKKEYVRGIVHTNFAESFFSLLKRGVMGTFHHVSEKHMPRYLAEFDFRWSNRKQTDRERAILAILGAEGKRLTYIEPKQVRPSESDPV